MTQSFHKLDALCPRCARRWGDHPKRHDVMIECDFDPVVIELRSESCDRCGTRHATLKQDGPFWVCYDRTGCNIRKNERTPSASVSEELPASDGRDQRESVEVTRSLDRGGNERRPSEQGVTAGETALHTCRSTPPGSACEGCRVEIAAERANVMTINMQSQPTRRRGGHVHTCPECHDNVPCDDVCSTSEDLRLDDGTDRGAYVECERCKANLANKAAQLKEWQRPSEASTMQQVDSERKLSSSPCPSVSVALAVSEGREQRTKEAKVGCVKCGQVDDRLDPDTGACYACFDGRAPRTNDPVRVMDEAFAGTTWPEARTDSAWPTTDEGGTHTRLTRIVDENLGYRETLPIGRLLDALEEELPLLIKNRNELEQMVLDRQRTEPAPLVPDSRVEWPREVLPYEQQSADWRCGYDAAEQMYHRKQTELRREMRLLRAQRPETPSQTEGHTKECPVGLALAPTPKRSEP